jgi:hypothetical protein
MRKDDISRLLRQQPFQRFRVHLTDGMVYEIRHPDMAIVTPSTMFIGVPAPGQTDGTAEHVEMVSLLHITRVEPVTTGAAPAPGGTAGQG